MLFFNSTILSLLFFLLFAGLVFSNFIWPRVFLFIAGFSLTLMSLSHQFMGINVTFHAYLGVLSLAILVLAPFRRWDALNNKPMNRLIIYIVVLTSLWMIFEYFHLKRYILSASVGLGPAQSTYRMPVQLASIVFQLLAFYIIPTRARNLGDIKAGIFGFVCGCLISVGIGLIMLATSDYGYIIDGMGRAAAVTMAVDFSRLGGLSGEPKHLGAFLVFGLVLLASVSLIRDRGIFHRQLPILFWVFLGALILTFSTSAWLAFITAIIILVFVVLKNRNRSRYGWAILLLFGAVLTLSQIPVANQMYMERVHSRVFDEEEQELEGSKNNYVWDMYRDNPHHAVWGMGTGGTELEATRYLLNDPKYAAQLRYNRTPTPSTNVVRLWGDIGLIGLLLLSLMVLNWYRHLKSLRLLSLGVFVIAAYPAMLLLSMNALPAFLFLSGGALTVARFRKDDVVRRSISGIHVS